ncbi:pescadillo homolog [Liolophura sinensis]|uniref:pescadillo homolog n=1 Tax=Liolophura sinensis TaxID=3198878 RepID=UPI0031586F63
MVKEKKKYESGAATAYISRNKALKKLQVSLPDFRRLCILKGIYPHEPKHKKKVGKGSTAPKTYYYLKDIQFLGHEPVLRKFREFKVFLRRLKKAVSKRNADAEARIRSNRPNYKLDHIVKERYPSFIDALRDLDDCLSMCFLFATFPKTKRTYINLIHLCRRLSVEFMHYVIAAKALRKVFISIKGIYYQAEIMGQTLTWVVPHKFGFEPPSEVDNRIMQTFVEFYTTMLGFVNFKLYTTLNLHYPPKLSLDNEDEDDTEGKCLDSEKVEERLSALTQTLQSVSANVPEEEVELDQFPAAESDSAEMLEKAQLEAASLKKLQNLFKGFKFYLNREVPRESLVFIIRTFGGEVSWDKSLAVGATYNETDETITHHIIDRPKLMTTYMSRYYIQPQWVFDSVNARSLAPVEEYFPGVVLPPHLSPFVEEEEGDYIPPEKQALLNKQRGIDSGVGEDDSENEALEGEESEDEEGEDEEGVSNDEDEEEDEDDGDSGNEQSNRKEKSRKRQKPTQPEANTKTKKRKKSDNSESKSQNTSVMSVEEGMVEESNPYEKMTRQEREEKRLAEMMIPKKKRRLYQKIMFKKKKKTQEARILQKKREDHDKKVKMEKKQRGKQAS